MPSLYLTFDDGPHPAWTPAVADALAAVGAQATFFVMAPAAHEQAALVRRLVAAGHAVELHASRHRRHSELDRVAVGREAVEGLRGLARVGIRPCRWRTPWGSLHPATPAVAAAHGLTLTGWTADTHDWRGDRAEAMVEVLAPGAVVLCHDGLGPGARRQDASETVRFVGRAAAWARERGLALEALPAPGDASAGLRILTGHPGPAPADALGASGDPRALAARSRSAVPA